MPQKLNYTELTSDQLSEEIDSPDQEVACIGVTREFIMHTPATLYIVATPIGNLNDISARALTTLRQVDLIAAEDTRHTGRLLQQAGIRRPLIALHEHNERHRVQSLIERLRAGTDIALVSDAGTPLISDPGYPLVRACHAAAIPVVPIPGPCALVTALSVSGLPTDAFYFAGFPPHKQSARRTWLDTLCQQTATLILYESNHRISATLTDMQAVFGSERRAMCARELTKTFETLLHGTLQEIQAGLGPQPKGEIVLVVAGATADPETAELVRYLDILLAELPRKQAVALTARLLQLPKNQVYQQALGSRSF